MQTVRLIGSLHPKAVLVSILLPDLDWKWEEQGINFKFRTKINNSIINVECDLPEWRDEFFAEIHKRSFDLAKAATNLLCFATGEGLTAVFDFFILPDGTPSTLRTHEPSLASLVQSFSVSENGSGLIKKVANIVITDPALFAALNDLVEAISVPHVSSVNCGRVVDSIRRLIAPGGEGGAAWKQMQDTLLLSRDYIELISKTSTGPRHGDRTHIPGNVTTEIVRRTWVVMARYLAFCINDRKALDPRTHPAL